MTLARMADRSLPLAERVEAALSVVPHGDETTENALTELLADIAAADRLARATDAWFVAVDGPIDEIAIGLRHADIDVALAAYRARMAQGVANG